MLVQIHTSDNHDKIAITPAMLIAVSVKALGLWHTCMELLFYKSMPLNELISGQV